MPTNHTPDTRSDPLVPAEVDLRDFDFMPLFGDRLFNSDTWSLCNADEKVAALRLWWRSWHEEPPASLPNSDRLLSERAGYGVAISAFLKIKPNAMRGWIECSDGRLYHPVVASIALDVWKTKRRKETGNEAERERKRLKRASMSAGQTHDVRRTSTQCPPDTPPDNQAMSTGQPPGQITNVRRKTLLSRSRRGYKKESPQTPTDVSGGQTPTVRRTTVQADFETWWQTWPHKVGKGQAERAYAIARKLASVAELLDGIQPYIAAKPHDRPWCNPATWLNGKRWLDQPAPNGADINPPVYSSRPTGPPPTPEELWPDRYPPKGDIR